MTNDLPIFLLIGLGALMMIKKTTPKNRGTRNNNWLNVRAPSSTYWVGQLRLDDKDFAIFSDPVYSLRATFKLFNTYRLKYGLSSIEQIISRFAPSNENDTENYIDYVAGKTGIDRHRPLTKREWPAVIRWMSKMETQNIPTDDQLTYAESLANV